MGILMGIAMENCLGICMVIWIKKKMFDINLDGDFDGNFDENCQRDFDGNFDGNFM